MLFEQPKTDMEEQPFHFFANQNCYLQIQKNHATLIMKTKWNRGKFT